VCIHNEKQQGYNTISYSINIIFFSQDDVALFIHHNITFCISDSILLSHNFGTLCMQSKHLSRRHIFCRHWSILRSLGQSSTPSSIAAWETLTHTQLMQYRYTFHWLHMVVKPTRLETKCTLNWGNLSEMDTSQEKKHVLSMERWNISYLFSCHSVPRPLPESSYHVVRHLQPVKQLG